MSGGQVAYHLRINKYIDRQLFMESLRLADRFLPISQYGYVSMAGPYLEDCRLIHRAVGISRMYSFDGESLVVARQRVNRPFGFIKLANKLSGDVVAEFDSVRSELGGEESNVVVWLDYADARNRLEQLREVGLLVPKLIHGDILRVTMNANRNTLGEVYHHQYLQRAGEQSSVSEWRHDRLKSKLGEYLPANRDNPEFLESRSGFFQTILQSIKQSVVKALNARRSLFAKPLLATAYTDSHEMVTICCAILDVAQESRFDRKTRWEIWPYKPGDDWDRFIEIQVPHLSVQERQRIHRMIACGGAYGDKCPSFIETNDLEQYQLHYNRYPTFAPLDVL